MAIRVYVWIVSPHFYYILIENKIINFVETLHEYFDPRDNCLVGSWHVVVVVHQ